MSTSRSSFIVYRLARRLLWIGLKLFFRFRSYGADNVPRSGGCIIVANHVSYLDPPVVGAGAMHRPMYFVARDTLFTRSAVGGWLMKNFNCIALDRTKGDIGAMKRTLRVLQAGEAVALFPEGTRSPNGALQEAKPGIGFLIAKAGVPVIPAYVEGTYEAFPKNARRLRLRPVKITYGSAIAPSELVTSEGRAGYERIGALVMERIAALAGASR